jgi:trk system potassium uptake protein TrkA
VRVLFGEPTNPDILAIEGIGDMDAFLAVTDDEESNIISCLMAKHLGVSKTVALISKKEYIPISQTIGLDAAVNTKLAASNEIHRHIRGGNVKSITSLHGITADVIEMEVSPGSKVDGKAIKKVSFPGGAVVGAIWSGEASDAEIVTGNSIMKAGDRVMLFAQASYLDRLTDLFQG